MIKKAQAAAERLLTKDQKIGVAVSGGADSIALLHFLKTLGYGVVCLHFEHGIRESSLADARFVEDFCKSLGVPFYMQRGNVPAYAEQNKLSIEAAARDLRYAFFSCKMQELGLGAVATAHHADDQAETVLLNLVRGCGLKGLCGMSSQRQPNIVRPFLEITRAQIEMYITQNELKYVFDETNICEDYSRNYIRHSVLPMLEKLNPSVKNTITRMAELLKDEQEALQSMAQAIFCEIREERENGFSLPLERFNALQPAVQRRIIRLCLGDLADIEKTHIDAVIRMARNKTTGKQIQLANKFLSIISYNRLIIFDKKYKIEMPGVFCAELGLSKLWKGHEINIQKCDEPPASYPASKAAVQYVNSIENTVIRTRRAGDRFTPFGMWGGKKLKEYFIDHKIPAHERDYIPLLVRGNEVLWIVGHALSEKMRCSPGAQVYKLEYIFDEGRR